MSWDNNPRQHTFHRYARIVLPLILSSFFSVTPEVVFAQTVQGEIESRPAPVFRRICEGGPDAGSLCNQDGVCPGSTCPDRNVFNISVSILFDATNAQISLVEDLITAGSAAIFDVTDGQAEIGQAFIYNNAFGTGLDADLVIQPSTNNTWWQAYTGLWQTGGYMEVSINHITNPANLGYTLAHEFAHLVFDVRDEYQDANTTCTVSGAEGSASCPDAEAIAAGEESSLMDQNGTEFCWGHGDPADKTDVSGGNHDADLVTEQSRCRDDRSCWEQVVWSWPNTFLAPVGAPDPAANGAIVNATQYVLADNTTRVVLVLDESGSMGIESPTRMERLQVAALDFVSLAENNTELGIVSYSDNADVSDGHANVAIAALGNNRSTWINAINGLSPGGWTNIGDALEEAKDMIINNGGVTANTFIILMTDGINNRPAPQSTAEADLQSKIDDLLDEGIPVYVTCTGGDLGLSSQCSEIAVGTGGFYVDSRDASSLPETFIDFHERISRRDIIKSYNNWIQPAHLRDHQGFDSIIYVEEYSESVTFTLVWRNKYTKASMTMFDPNGNAYPGQSMPQGSFVRVNNPLPGDWVMKIDWGGGSPDSYVTRAYSKNRVHSLGAGVRYASVLPGEEIYIYALPQSYGGAVTHPEQLIQGTVIRPDGSTDLIELNDMGRSFPGGGDDAVSDGIFTGVYKTTLLKGPYQFLIHADIDNWQSSIDKLRVDQSLRTPRFERQVRVSVAVGDPADVVKNPEDKPKDEPPATPWCKYLFYVVIILIIILIWRISLQRRKAS